jgi:hypothetical protein
MGKRILLYAAIYGGIGVAVGVLMAFYTAEGVNVHTIPKTITLGKIPVAPEVTKATAEEVAEAVKTNTPVEEE